MEFGKGSIQLTQILSGFNTSSVRRVAKGEIFFV